MKIRYILLIIILSYLFFALFYHIFYPAYLSVKSDCSLITEEELNQSGYFLSGQYNPCNDTITIFYNTTSVNLHEQCHQHQYSVGRMYSCSNKVFLYMNEMFCYSSEYLPNKIYNLIYN